MKTIFIVSTGRTGTDFFTSLFNEAVPQAWSLHEPKPAFRSRGYELLSRKHSFFEKHYFRIPRLVRHHRAKKRWYVETNYHLFTCIDLIRDAFPDSLIVHVIRDGRDVVRSWLNKWRYITNDHITPYHIPGDPAQAYWKVWNPLQKLSWYWKTVNEVVEEKEVDLWLRFEDVFGGDPDGVEPLLNLLRDVDIKKDKVSELLQEKVNPSPRTFFPPYDDWPEYWKTEFWNIAGDTMKRMGYE